MPAKVCVDCRFYRAVNVCGHPEAIKRDLVSGISVCHIERRPDNPCGPDARLFEPAATSRWKRLKAAW